jgi:hypothetical protein
MQGEYQQENAVGNSQKAQRQKRFFLLRQQ